MKNQALFSLKDKSKKLKSCLLQFLIGTLRVNTVIDFMSTVRLNKFSANSFIKLTTL